MIAEFLRSRWVVLSIIVMIVIVFMSPFFGYAFEPLDLVAEHFNATETTTYEAPMPDYTTPGIEGDISGVVAGIIGILITLVVGLVIGYTLKGNKTTR